jgi:hypothetical protein
MAAKPVRFHEDADAEYENAFDWYLARSPLRQQSLPQN